MPPAAASATTRGGTGTSSANARPAAAALRDAGHTIDVAVDEAADHADPATRRTLTRIIRESTTNIVRYAPASAACTLRIATTPAGFAVTVANPLPNRARRSESSTGWGLIGLAERVRITGGTFAAEPVGEQWVLQAHLLFAPEANLA